MNVNELLALHDRHQRIEVEVATCGVKPRRTLFVMWHSSMAMAWCYTRALTDANADRGDCRADRLLRSARPRISNGRPTITTRRAISEIACAHTALKPKSPRLCWCWISKWPRQSCGSTPARSTAARRALPRDRRQPMSRPIVEKNGFQFLTFTQPFKWQVKQPADATNP